MICQEIIELKPQSISSATMDNYLRLHYNTLLGYLASTPSSQAEHSKGYPSINSQDPGTGWCPPSARNRREREQEWGIYDCNGSAHSWHPNIFLSPNVTPTSRSRETKFALSTSSESTSMRVTVVVDGRYRQFFRGGSFVVLGAKKEREKKGESSWSTVLISLEFCIYAAVGSR